ncbi:hypothetical protein CBR_g12067 [Chara braunii]|uniref:Uncharacterized protein n=1 Tax=Chara braunii TaxID=69332 RepID=A0A388KR31_CHABU|nr:hypothetical protein CBR_g12067 [Chara braunii]|eukprot:GBG72496.1 hypothetical protein CBR_g12067 [Chara braunii]
MASGRDHGTPAGMSMIYSFLLFLITLSAQQVYKEKLASSEWFTILGGFVSSLLFLFLLTFIGNFQETVQAKTKWAEVIICLTVAMVAASTVHRVCVTTCFLFSALFIYEVNKMSAEPTVEPKEWKKESKKVH